MEDRTDLMARRSVSRILRASAQIKKCTKLNGPGADHSHYPTLAVRIIRTIHLTMAQVNQKVCSPIPLRGRDTSGSFWSLLWRRFGFQGVAGIVMEASPAPTHFSRVSEAGSSPGQCQHQSLNLHVCRQLHISEVQRASEPNTHLKTV